MYDATRILSKQADENGVFLVWGNAQEWSNDGSRDTLSFTYNCDVFHVYLDIETIIDLRDNSDLISKSCLEIGTFNLYLKY